MFGVGNVLAPIDAPINSGCLLIGYSYHTTQPHAPQDGTTTGPGIVMPNSEGRNAHNVEVSESKDGPQLGEALDPIDIDDILC